MTLIQRFTQFLSDGPPGPADDYWYEDAPARSPRGKSLTPVDAMRSSAVWGCIRIIAETVASLPLHVYRRDGSSKQLAVGHRLYRTLHDSPNRDMSAFEFWEGVLTAVLMWGNAYASIELNSRADVATMQLMNPARVQVIRDWVTKRKVFIHTPEGGAPDILQAEDVLHIPGFGYDGLTGYSPIRMHAQSIGLALDAEEYAAGFFANRAMPAHYISYPGNVADGKEERLLKWLAKRFKGPWNSHRIGILEGGAEIKTVPVNHRDIQFLETRKYQVEDIARIFRVPLHLLQSLERATNNNIEHQGIDFVTHTIRPWVERIEQRINMQLLGPIEGREYFAEFALDGLLRGDAKSRADYYMALRNGGVITANEIRRLENMEPLDGGDELFIQGAMVPVAAAVANAKEKKQ